MNLGFVVYQALVLPIKYLFPDSTTRARTTETAGKIQRNKSGLVRCF